MLYNGSGLSLISPLKYMSVELFHVYYYMVLNFGVFWCVCVM